MDKVCTSASYPRAARQSKLGRPGASSSLAVLCLALVVPALTGCGSINSPSSSGSPPTAGTCLTNKPAPLALAIGARSNVPEESLPAIVTPLLEAAATRGQRISLIRIDGQPKIFTPPTFTTDAQNGPARQQALANYVANAIIPILHGEIRAQVPQADVLTALSLAASTTAPNGNIILVDSGLQTTDPLDYRQPGLLMAPPSDVVSFLRRENLLPDLRGRHVLLAGFGYTASPQPELNQAQRDNVISQWEAIIKAGGGCVTADTVADTSPEISSLPPVGIVNLPPPPVFSNCGSIALEDAGTVGFIVGTAHFRNPSAAQATLQRLADKLKQGSEHITLVGSTSSEGGDAINDALSLARAKAVEDALISMGVPASRITTVGDGSHWPGRVNDVGPGSELLPGPAEQDREVIVQLPRCH
jgi:OmpA-OmpF porin, OOP family